MDTIATAPTREQDTQTLIQIAGDYVRQLSRDGHTAASQVIGQIVQGIATRYSRPGSDAGEHEKDT